ncbi:hypothetical protein [Tessaracoccus antarcticus]|uniref:Right-handed parallel beta-helix repeat-containing protein n=1 Tax=Tessaracoccus antarcticus TaxID=2479848 RepID=A0A3M0G8D7_9ACTN|nr:hypothetical protein [Tessaracoccus antarcticus]RMB61290.1 hypothetical protein EAX62_01050 [Tessaracoccus antarcticus]
MKNRAIFGTVLATGLVLAATTTPASADLVTRCIGTAGAVTVPGDLVVPAGQACTLTGTTVEGAVRVMAGADLVVVDATFNDTVAVAADAYFDATTSTVAGTVTNRGFGVSLDRSELGGDVRGRAGTDASSFTYLYNSAVAGQVDARAGDLLLDSSQVTGQVRGLGTTFVDVINSTLSGALTVKDNTEGTSVCASEVDGETRLTGNTGVQVGDGDLLGSCTDGANYFGSSLQISNTTAGVSVRGNIIRGDLTGTGNDPAPTGGGNRVRGTLGGQFADMAATAQVQARARVLAAQPDRGTEARTQLEQRRTAAVTAATEAGPAQL